MTNSIIFDLDGTLLDTLTDLAISVNFVLEKYNFKQHPVDKYKDFIGDGMDMLLKKATNFEADDSLIQNMIYDMKKHYENQWKKNTKPYDKIDEMLKILKQKEYKLAVFSNKTHEFTVTMVKYFFDNIFDLVQGLNEHVVRKPDPQGAIYIKSKLNIDFNSTLMVGDSPTDIQFAHNSNMKALGVSWGYKDVELLKKENPLGILNNPMDIFDYL